MIVLLLSWFVVGTAWAAPSFDGIRESYRPSETWFVDRHGKPLHEIRRDNRLRRLEWVRLEEISPAFVAALLKAEDKRFYRHGGVDFLAFGGVALRLLAFRKPRGASTLTMQLASFLEESGGRRRRSLWQKLRQIAKAWDLERTWTKSQILEAYANLVTFRGELSGIGAASRALFDKSPHGLSVGESAVLVSLIRAPNARVEVVSRRACALVPPDECGDVKAKTESSLGQPYRIRPRTAEASHVATRLLAERSESVVPTTLDVSLQRWANEALRRHLIPLKDRHVADGAVLIVENSTGNVLAYVGSSGDLGPSPQVDGIQAPRQAGSSLKPFLYALAFEKKLLTPATLLDDSPADIPVAGGIYRPKNYDHRFQGPVSARFALGSSLNVPAVRALLSVGVEPLVARLGELEFKGLREPDYYGPSLALGAADVTLWELANAYRTLANGGIYSPLRLLPSDPQPSRRVFNEGVSFLISNILSDRAARSLTFGLESPLGTRFWSAVKTGTSKDMRDNWCIGYSGYYTVAVWVGNFSGDPMWNVSGISGAAPLWVETLRWLHRDTASEPPQLPRSVVERETQIEGEPGRREFFLAETAPQGPAQLARPIPRITYPATGTLLALDPDMPLAHQSVFIEANIVDNELSWELNGETRGKGSRPLKWIPRAGKHVVKLVDSKRNEVDSVSFEVRGSHGGEDPQ